MSDTGPLGYLFAGPDGKLHWIRRPEKTVVDLINEILDELGIPYDLRDL